jgi:hypothetical protein
VPKKPVQPEERRRAPGGGRKPTINAVKARTVKLDADLEALFMEEHHARRQVISDLDWTEATTHRQLLREALQAAKAKREHSLQQNLPLESSTTKP